MRPQQPRDRLANGRTAKYVRSQRRAAAFIPDMTRLNSSKSSARNSLASRALAFSSSSA